MTSLATHLVGYQLHTWTGSTTVFIFYWPRFFPSFPLGGCIWSAGLTLCPREMTEDLDTSNWAGMSRWEKATFEGSFHICKGAAFLSEEGTLYTCLEQRRIWESTPWEHCRYWSIKQLRKMATDWRFSEGHRGHVLTHKTPGCYGSPASHLGTGPSDWGPGAATPPTWTS